MTEAMIGYVVKGYPRISEAFITNEVYHLERAGLRLRIFSVKESDEAIHHAIVGRIGTEVTYLPQVTSLTQSNFWDWLRHNLPKFTASHRALFHRHPVRYVRTLALALRMSLVYRAGLFAPPKKVFLKEFLQAGAIAMQALESGSIRHLHAHFCHGATTIALFASQLSGIPFSFTAHAKDIYLAKLNPGDLLESKIKRARFVVTCTAANKAYLERLRPNGTPIHTVYHGLDTEMFAPATMSVDPSTSLRILCVGRLVEKKGIPYLVEACRILRDRGYRFQCTIVGEPGDQSGLLRSRIRDLRLQEVVNLSPALTHDGLKEEYRRSALFALPCLVARDGDRDGIPNVLAEAMAMGLPVVSTRVSGIPELITDEVDGLLVPERDVSALADALSRLLDDAALRRRLGQAAREKICQMFDARQTTRVLRDLFTAQLEIERTACDRKENHGAWSTPNESERTGGTPNDTEGDHGGSRRITEPGQCRTKAEGRWEHRTTPEMTTEVHGGSRSLVTTGGARRGDGNTE